MLREDGPVETLTAVLLGLAALFALIAAFRVPDTLRWPRPFLILFCVFSALMALEVRFAPSRRGLRPVTAWWALPPSARRIS